MTLAVSKTAITQFASALGCCKHGFSIAASLTAVVAHQRWHAGTLARWHAGTLASDAIP
ncbi:hypothetical protein [Paracoccus jeotgali]|uniref:hypothetical protein n=1 Tax=Paracoccus jeotgali TaxID=2065379 RepID=UPI0028A96FFE|nr:hypothetical protein [Paracoccus jeotgali]